MLILLDSFRALNLIDWENLKFLKYSKQALIYFGQKTLKNIKDLKPATLAQKFWGPKTVQSGELVGPKFLQSGNGNYMVFIYIINIR